MHGLARWNLAHRGRVGLVALAVVVGAFVMLVAMVSELVLTRVLLSCVRLVAVWDAVPAAVAGGDD